MKRTRIRVGPRPKSVAIKRTARIPQIAPRSFCVSHSAVASLMSLLRDGPLGDALRADRGRGGEERSEWRRWCRGDYGGGQSENYRGRAENESVPPLLRKGSGRRQGGFRSESPPKRFLRRSRYQNPSDRLVFGGSSPHRADRRESRSSYRGSSLAHRPRGRPRSA